MNERKHLTHSVTVGDAAVDGLFGGVVAGIGMAGYLALAGVALGEGPGQMLARFAPDAETAALTGALMHLAVASVYGMLFGIGWWLLARRRHALGWLVGLVYGIALLFVAEVLILPGTDSPLVQIPLVHFALAHVFYGTILGFLVGRNANRPV